MNTDYQKRIAEIEAREAKARKECKWIGGRTESPIYFQETTVCGKLVCRNRPALFDFINHGRLDIPWLLAHLRERDAELERLKAFENRVEEIIFNPSPQQDTESRP